MSWRSKKARPEPRQEVTLGEAFFVAAYKGEKYIHSEHGLQGGRAIRYYETCAQAFEDGCLKAEKARLVKIGDDLFVVPDDFWLYSVNIQPKPKIEKGREHGDGTP